MTTKITIHGVVQPSTLCFGAYISEVFDVEPITYKNFCRRYKEVYGVDYEQDDICDNKDSDS